MIGKLEELWQIERAKDAVQKYSIDEILDAFEKDKIDCVPLKGIYMKMIFVLDPVLEPCQIWIFFTDKVMRKK